MGDIHVDPKYTISAFYNPLLYHLLLRYEKILYVDCDMVFRNGLGERYEEAVLRDKYLTGVFEGTLPAQHADMEGV